jgi:hypothetical protein
MITRKRLVFRFEELVEHEGILDLSAVRYSGPDVAELDEDGRRIYFRACDTSARFWLNDCAMPEFDAGNFEGCAMLVHAERYLADRLAYELGPWPKGMMRNEPEDAYALPKW